MPPQSSPRLESDTHRSTLLIATRSELLEVGLSSLIAEMPHVEHVSSANDAPEIVSSLMRHRPNVLVLDHALAAQVHELAHGTGINLAGDGPRVLLLSPGHHLGTESRCADDRACGLVREQSPLPNIRSALRTIVACNSSRVQQDKCDKCPLRPTVLRPKLGLSEREYEVFERIGRGQGTQRIARELQLSVKTVETHRSSIKLKLGLDSASSLTEAAAGWRRGEYVRSSASFSREGMRSPGGTR